MYAVLWITILLFPPQVSQEDQIRACLAGYPSKPTAEIFTCVKQIGRSQEFLEKVIPLWQELTLAHPNDSSLWYYLSRFQHFAKKPWRVTMEKSQQLALEQGNIERIAWCTLQLLGAYQDEGMKEAARWQIALLMSQPNVNELSLQTWLQFTNQHLRFLLEAEGDLEEADLLLQETEEDSRYAGTTTEFHWLLRKGQWAMRMGDNKQARVYLQKYVDLAYESEEVSLEVTGRSNLLSINDMILEPSTDNIRTFLQQASHTFDFARENKGSDRLARLMMARTLKNEESVVLATEGLADAKEKNNTLWQIHFQSLLASLLANSDPDTAQDHLTQAMTLADNAKFHWWASSNATLQLHTLWDLLPSEEALDASLQLLDNNEQMGKRDMGDYSKVMMRSAWTEIYYALAGKLLSNCGNNNVDQAFLVMERMRARGLMEHLFSNRIATNYETQEDGTTMKGLPSVYGTLEFASLNQIREHLQPDEAILSFQMGYEKNLYAEEAGGAWLYVVTKADVKLYPLPNILELVPGLETYIGLFSDNPDPAVVSSASVKIYERLLAPALLHLNPAIDKLTLVPDGILHHFPFATLRASSEAPVLASRFQLQVVPSATLWLRWRQSEVQPDLPALVFADPYLGIAEDGSVSLRGWAPGRRLSQLPFALKEGKAVAKYLGSTTRLVSGNAASEGYLKQQDLDQWGLLHFAAHAVIDQQIPHHSAVVLAQGLDDEDGLLHPPEIAALNLTGKMVVLSTCQSASGLTLKGEGVMSLARAFMRAGAHTVVATLWPLEDDQASQFFKVFYRNLAKGKSNGEALQRAQGRLINKGAPPNAWAGVVLMGDGSYVPFPNQRPPLGFKVPLLLIFTIVCIALMTLRIFSRRGASTLQSTHSNKER